MSLEERITSHLRSRHVLDHGFADLGPAGDYVVQTAAKECVDFPRAVSIAVPFPSGIIDLLAGGPSRTYLYYYREVNNRLNQIALEIDSILSFEGFRSLPVPASRRRGKERVNSIFPHRLAANLGGLGWIGKSGLLIHPSAGPRLRLVTVLTDAPLTTSEPVEDRCGSCTACIDECPGGALAERKEFNDWRGNQVDAIACDRHLAEVRDRHGIRVCGLCLLSCPWGR